ncbi:MAG: DnaA regulatory inactivator Hda [Sulfuricella denitrificans]|nr:DnaA regulatory inactivator Hda [Sulfuricella denitrificans]
MKQLLLEISPVFAPALDNFVAGRNGELMQILRQLLAGSGHERAVYLWGEAGSGKTHLLHGLVAAAQEAGRPALLATAGEALPVQPEAGMLVAVDDVALLNAEGQIALFNLYNDLRENGGAFVASGPCPPAQLEVRPDVATRLGWGLVYQVQGLSDAEKEEALQSHARARGFSLPQEVLDYLLRHWRRDLPSLMAVLDALDRITLEQQRPVTVPLLRQLLQIEMDL